MHDQLDLGQRDLTDPKGQVRTASPSAVRSPSSSPSEKCGRRDGEGDLTESATERGGHASPRLGNHRHLGEPDWPSPVSALLDALGGAMKAVGFGLLLVWFLSFCAQVSQMAWGDRVAAVIMGGGR